MGSRLARELTVTEENLALACRSIGVCIGIGLPQLIAGFDVDQRALLNRTEVIVGRGIERKNIMPGSSRLCANRVRSM